MMGTSKTRWARRVARWTRRQQVVAVCACDALLSADGIVIGVTQDPNVRAYLDGLNVIFMNAIFRGSAHARPMH